MRAVAFLLMLSFAGYVSTQFAWQTGKQYTYQVRGRLMTGISEINTQYAGLEVEYKMVLTAVGPNTIVLKPQGFKAVEVNAEIEGGWREGELKDQSPIDIKGELREYLESPIEATVRQGVVDSIKVEAHLPTWAVNIKKAQVSHFVLDTTGVNVVLQGNLNRKTNSVRPEEANQESGFFYETMEDTVHGECETYYTVSQNGPFDSPFPFQRNAQPGQQDSQEQNSAEKNQNQRDSRERRDSRESSEEQKKKYAAGFGHYQKDSQYNKQYNYEKKAYKYSDNSQEASFEDKQKQQYFGAQQSEEEYKPYGTYQQYAAYKQYAQQADSGSAEDSQETRDGEQPWAQTFDRFCDDNDQIYEIVKAINFTTCKNKPVLAYSTTAGLYGRAGDNAIGSAWERAVITRFLACGRDRKQYTILKIKQEEQVNFGLRLTQKTLAGSVQNLTLISIAKAAVAPKIQNPKVINDLSYTFDPQEQQLQKKGQIPNAHTDDLEENKSSEERADGSANPRSRSRQSSESNESQEQQQQFAKKNYQQKYQQKVYDEAQQYQYQAQAGGPNRHNSREEHSRRPRSATSGQQDSSEESKEQNANQFYATEAEGKGQLPKPSLTKAPLNPLLVSPLQTSGMKNRVQALMKEIVEDITTDKQSMAEAETLSKISTVAKILRFLDIKDVEELYNKIADKRQTEEDQTARNIFLDAMAIAGTNPNIKFLTDLIEKKQLTGEHAAQIIMTFPLYVRTPTPALIKEIFELTDSSAVESDGEQVKTSAVLALSNLLYQACVNSRIRNSRYPVALYGEFCDEKLAQRTYAPWFTKNLKKHLEGREPQDKHWVATYLTALGNLGVPEVVPVVQQILDDETDPYIKVKAVLALKNLIVSRQAENIPVAEVRGVDRQSQDLLTDDFIENQVLPILIAVSADKGEHPEVRMAAISLLLYTTNADLTVWQQMAYSTWFSASQEVHSFIYSSLKSLAELKNPISRLHRQMQKKARAVISLAKPMNPGMGKSRNVFNSQFVEHLQSGFFHHFEYFGSKDSRMPNYMFYRNNVQYGNGAQGVTPVEFSVQGHTVQKLVSYVLQQLRKQTSEQEPHPELEQVHQLLGIEARDQDEEIEGSFRLKIRSEMERLFSINEQKIQQLIKQAKGQALPKLLNGLPINYQKTFHLLEHSLEMPSAMGIPITYHLRMPVHFSLRGTLKIVNENGLKDVQLQAELHPVYAWKTHGKISFKAPFTGKKYQAGVQRHMVVEAPFRALVRKAPRGQVVVAITPSQLTNGSPSGKIDLITFHQRPYTAIINDEFWPTSHKEGGSMVIVHAVETPFKNEREFGQKALGMNFILKEETEYRTQNEGSSGWVKFWKRFHSPTCFFNVGWLGAPQIRPVERKVQLDVSKSETKTLAIIVGAKIHQSAQYADLWADSSSQSSQSSEESASSESKQDSSSQQQQDSQEKKNKNNKNNKYYKSNTRGDRRSHEQNNAQDQEDPSQSGRVIAVALIGKRIPIRSPKEAHAQIQKILQKENPSTIQYFAQVSHSLGRFYVRAASGDAANEAAASLPQSSPSLQALREAVVQAQNAKTQQDGCAEFEGEYDAPKHANRHELIVLRKVLLNEELQVKIKAELQFGQSCKQMPHEIKVQGKLNRGPKMTEWAQKKSPEAQKCEEDEKKGFSVSPVCMYVAEQQAAALNQADLKFTFSNQLPVQFLNRTDDVEDFVKAYLYPYMSHDRFHQGAGERTIRVQAHMTPSKDFIDVIVTKPNSRLSFRSIRTNRFVRAFLPLTATQSMANNFRDRAFRLDSESSCNIEGNQVNTFDNVTYRFNKEVSSDCYHVLAKDCSKRQPVAVLVKDVTAEKKEFILLLGAQTKIELLQHQQQNGRSLQGKAKLQVEVNEQRVESLPKVIRAKDTGKFIAKIELMNDGGIQVISPQFQLATNGKYVIVYAANSLRNRTCGLCGNFDGEKVGELRGPKDCPLSSGSLMVASYAYQSLNSRDKAQCKVEPQAKKQIAHEEANCLTTAAFLPNQPGMFNSQRQYQTRRQDQNNQNNQNNQNQDNNRQPQAPISSECVEKVKREVRAVVYDVVKTSLKPFVWHQIKRQQYANKVADDVAAKVQEVLDNNQQAEAIAKAIAKHFSNEMRRVPVVGWVIEGVSKVTSPLLSKAVLLVVNPICKTSGCCTPSREAFNPSEIQQEIAYLTADESEVDPSPVPFIPAHQFPMPCLQKLETTLPKSLSKIAFMILVLDRDMSFTQRREISDNVFRLVREAIVSTMARGGNGRLTETIVRDISAIFPKGNFEKLFTHIIRRLVPLTLLELEKEGCKFPVTNTQNNQQNHHNNQNHNQNNNRNQN
jgi:hypothetical protein